MIFKQYDDGSCDIEFSNEEIKIINENKKLHLSNESLKHFGNNLVQIVAEWHKKFSENLKKQLTYKETEIKGK